MNGEMSFLVVMLPLRVYVCCKCSMYLGTLRCPLFLSSFADPQHLPYCCSSMFRVVLADSVTHLTFIGFVASLEVSKWISGFCSEFFWRPWWHFWKPWREDDGRWGTAAHRVSRYRLNVTTLIPDSARSRGDSEPGEQSNVFEEIVCGKREESQAELNKDRSAWCHDGCNWCIQILQL